MVYVRVRVTSTEYAILKTTFDVQKQQLHLSYKVKEQCMLLLVEATYLSVLRVR